MAPKKKPAPKKKKPTSSVSAVDLQTTLTEKDAAMKKMLKEMGR